MGDSENMYKWHLESFQKSIQWEWEKNVWNVRICVNMKIYMITQSLSFFDEEERKDWLFPYFFGSGLKKFENKLCFLQDA